MKEELPFPQTTEDVEKLLGYYEAQSYKFISDYICEEIIEDTMETRMELLKLLQEKYHEHKIKYIPKFTCVSCKGAGEYRNRNGDYIPCICTCVEFPEIGEIFKLFVDRELKEIRGE